MNKLLLSGGTTSLDKFMNLKEIIVKEDSILSAINLNQNLDLHIILEENSSLTFNLFNYANDLKISLEIEAKNHSKFILNNSFISEVKYELDINTNLYGDDIECSVNIRGVNEKRGTVKILMNGQVAGETKNNVLNEYAKIINKSEYSNVLIPNLIVNTNDIVANHGVSIGSVREDELFYLMSKGINKFTAKKMLEEGFLLSIMDGEDKEKIKNILMGR